MLVTISLMFSGAITAQDTIPIPPQGSKSPESAHGPLYYPFYCTTDQPLYSDRRGNPIRLDTLFLMRSATHCEEPSMPPLARSLGIEGYVSMDILVNDKGNISCIKYVTGHAMLASSAMDAAKRWTFLPKKQNGKDVWFYGRLRLRVSAEKSGRSNCLIAR